MQKIATILPRYRELNQTYSTILVRGTVRYDELCFISAFLQQFSDRQLFEAMLIAMTLDVNSEKCSVLLKSLDGEIKNNISLYEANKPFWSNIDMEQPCLRFANRYHLDIEHQHQITKEHSDELNLINSSLEAIGFRQHTQQEEDKLWEKHKQLTDLYKREQEKLNALYDKQKEAQREVATQNTNNFAAIFELSNSLLAILNKYLPVEKENSQQGQEPLTMGAYFDMRLISAIHKKCNNVQFEDISEMELYAFLNNMKSDKPVTIKWGEKIRVCYLIYKLYEHLRTNDRVEWRNKILRSLGIKESLYAAKYKEPASEIPSRKSKSFAQRIDDILA